MIQVGPLIQYDWCAYEKRYDTERERDTQGECHVMMEVDIGVIQLQANNGKDLPIPETKSK